MPLRKFLIWTTFGSLIWIVLLTYAGFFFGENYLIIENYLDQVKFFLKPISVCRRPLAIGRFGEKISFFKI